ncbi:MAG TPA: ABC transporter substrate-binding protein [Limnochordia bacterium]
MHSVRRQHGWVALALVAGLLSTAASATAATRVEFWTPFGAGTNLETLNELIARFHELEPDIEVVHRGVPGDMAQQYKVAVAAGTPPDIGWVAPEWFPEFYTEDILVPVDALARRDGLDVRQFWPGTWGETLGGRQWGYPFEIGSEALIYNQDQFAAAGLGASPATWDDFLTAAQKLTRPDEGRFGAQVGWAGYIAVQWLWRNGGGLVSEDLTQATLTDPRTVEALQWYVDLEVEHGVAGGGVPQGTSAMIVVHPGWYGLAQTFPFEFGTGPAPIPQGGQRASLSYYKELVIFKTEPVRQEAAWRFVKWLMAPEQNAVWATRTGYLPISRAVLQTERYREYLRANPRLNPWLDELNHIRSFPYIPAYGQILALLEQAIGRIRQGEAAYPVLSSLQPRAQALLDEERERQAR